MPPPKQPAAKPFAKADFTGGVLSETGWDDDYLDLHPANDIPMDQLERQVDREAMNTLQPGDADAGETLEEAENRMAEQALQPTAVPPERRPERELSTATPLAGEVDSAPAAGEGVEAGEATADEGVEETLEQRVSRLAAEVEAERARNESLAASVDIWRTRADQHAGIRGNLETRLAALETRRPSPDDFPTDGEPRTPAPDPALREIREFRADLARRDNVTAMGSVEQEFFSSEVNPNSFRDSILKDHGAQLATAFERDYNLSFNEFANDLRSVAKEGTSDAAAKVARAAFRSAFADARFKHLSRLSTAARTVRSEQDAQRAAAKRAASPIASATPAKAAPGATRKQDPRTRDMSMGLDDMERAIDRAYGISGGGDGRDIFAR